MLEFTGSMLQPVSGIYEIRNIHTGQCYIGQSKVILARWATHFAQLGAGQHSLVLLQRDWDEYGPDAFKASVVRIVDNDADLLAEEAATALQYIASGTKLYNAAIGGWLNDEERAAQKARARVIAQREKRLLQRKRAKENETWNQGCGDSGDEDALRTERGVQGGGGIFRDSPGSSVESDKRGVCKPQAGLFTGEQGIDTEAGTERPSPQGVDENRQRRESYPDDREVLPIFNRRAAEDLTDHIPDDEKEEYLQTLIADTLAVSGGTAIDLALIIQAAFSEEDALEAWHILDPNTVTVFFNLTDEEDAWVKEFVDTQPGGWDAWIGEKIKILEREYQEYGREAMVEQEHSNG